MPFRAVEPWNTTNSHLPLLLRQHLDINRSPLHQDSLHQGPILRRIHCAMGPAHPAQGDGICKTCVKNSFSLHKNTDTDCPFNGGCDSCQSFARLDLEISELEARLAEVSQQRQALRTKMNSDHDRLIHRFPFEITCQIFNYVVEDERRKSRKDPGDPVLVLGGVCKTWRNITLNIPELWSKVVIDLWKVSSTEWVEVSKDWVRRSGHTPLFVTIKAVSSQSYVDEELVRQALELVVPFLGSLSGRWSGLTFNGQSQIMCSLLNGLEHPPQVDVLQLTFPPVNLGSQPVPLPPTMKGKFNPRHLSVAGLTVLNLVPLGWERLTRLDVSHIAINELLHIVLAAPHLHILNLTTITRLNGLNGLSDMEFPMPTRPIVSRSLIHLDTEQSAYVGILRHLTLPALQTLKHGFNMTGLDYQVFPDFVKRSGLQFLTHFSFVYQLDELPYPQSDEDCQYDHMPAVTHLHIGIPPSGVKTRQNILGIGERLLHPLRRRQAFPLLREISITAPLLSTASWSHLSDFLGHAKVNNNAATNASVVPQVNPLRPLERVSVKLTGKEALFKPDVIINEQDCIRLMEVQASGVDITLTAQEYGDKPLDLVVLLRDVGQVIR